MGYLDFVVRNNALISFPETYYNRVIGKHARLILETNGGIHTGTSGGFHMYGQLIAQPTSYQCMDHNYFDSDPGGIGARFFISSLANFGTNSIWTASTPYSINCSTPSFMYSGISSPYTNAPPCILGRPNPLFVNNTWFCPDSNNYLSVQTLKAHTIYYTVTNNTCYGSKDGKIKYNILGGSGSYSISIDNSSVTTNPAIGITSGLHWFKVTDGACIDSFQFEITQPPMIIWDSVTYTNVTCDPATNNGMIYAAASGGTGNITYSIQPGATQNLGSFTNLTAQVYTVTATDSSGCSISTLIHIEKATSDFCCSSFSDTLVHTPNLILLDNKLATDLIALNGGNNYISNKTIYVNGLFTIDSTIYLHHCSVYFTQSGSVILNAGSNLYIDSSSELTAACDWWEGIMASNANNKLSIQNSKCTRSQTGIVIQNNAELELVNNEFINNPNSSVMFMNMGDSTYAGKIWGNIFKGDNMPVYNGYLFPQNGIIAMNCKKLEIGDSTSSLLGNSFDNFRNGITVMGGVSISSSIGSNTNKITIYNNHFSNIHNEDTSSIILLNNAYTSNGGAAIYIDYGNAPLFDAHTMIDNANAGIIASMNKSDKAVVSINSHMNCTNLKIFDTPLGLLHNQTTGKQYVLNNNILEHTFIGIQLNGDNGATEIKYNLINCDLFTEGIITGPAPHPKKWPKGIEVSFFSNANTSSTKIEQNNNITIPHRAGNGITINNGGSGVKIANNQIHLTSTDVEQQYCTFATTLWGIGVNNSKLGKLNNNQVYCNTNNSTADQYRTDHAGILINSSKDMALGCNLVDNARFGIMAWNNCQTDSLNIKGNTIYQTTLGWVFRHLGDEGTFGNVGGNSNDNNNRFTGTTPAANVFKFCDTLDPYRIYTDSSRIKPTQSQSLNINSYVQNDCRYGIILNPFATVFNQLDCASLLMSQTPRDFTLEEALAIASDTKVYPEFQEIMHWYDSKNLYRYLQLNTDFKNQHTILINFFTEMSNNAIMQEQEADQKLEQLIGSFTAEDQTNKENNLGDAQSENDDIDISQSLQDYYEREINGLYLKLLKAGKDSINEEEIELIQTLAYSCPYINGSAVFKARTLLSFWDIAAQYDDMKICNTAGVYKSSNQGESNLTTIITKENEYLQQVVRGVEKNVINKGEIIIYPIPAEEYVDVKYRLETDAVFNLYNSIGDKILTTKLNHQQNNQRIEFNLLSNGLYHYEILVGDQTKYDGKITLYHE